jgi:ABC-type multidrug transport system ATPase subunit
MTPRFLFLDEPLNGLDPATAKSVLNHINDLCLKEHITVLIATHHFDLLEDFDTQVILLENGIAQHYYSVKEARQSTLANSIIQHNFEDRGLSNG